MWKVFNTCPTKNNDPMLLSYLPDFLFFPASYLLKLSHSEDYFKEEEKFRVDENKRTNRRKNKRESVTSDL